MKYFESALGVFSAIGSYILLLATPDKIAVAALLTLIVVNFGFAVWAYFRLKEVMAQEKKSRSLFEQRFLLTEIRADLLIAKHAERHPEDGNEFYTKERKLMLQRWEELKKWELCGSCVDTDKPAN